MVILIMSEFFGYAYLCEIEGEKECVHFVICVLVLSHVRFGTQLNGSGNKELCESRLGSYHVTTQNKFAYFYVFNTQYTGK